MTLGTDLGSDKRASADEVDEHLAGPLRLERQPWTGKVSWALIGQSHLALSLCYEVKQRRLPQTCLAVMSSPLQTTGPLWTNSPPGKLLDWRDDSTDLVFTMFR